MHTTFRNGSRPGKLQYASQATVRPNTQLASRWLASQNTLNVPISTNQPSLQLPFQRWFKFKEAFSPQFIIDCVADLRRPPRTCIDPFGGCGTTALTSQFLGICRS